MSEARCTGLSGDIGSRLPSDATAHRVKRSSAPVQPARTIASENAVESQGNVTVNRDLCAALDGNILPFGRRSSLTGPIGSWRGKRSHNERTCRFSEGLPDVAGATAPYNSPLSKQTQRPPG